MAGRERSLVLASECGGRGLPRKKEPLKIVTAATIADFQGREGERAKQNNSVDKINSLSNIAINVDNDDAGHGCFMCAPFFPIFSSVICFLHFTRSRWTRYASWRIYCK